MFGWPLDDAATVAVQTVAETTTTVETVTFVLFSTDAAAAFERALDAAGL